VIRDEFEQNLFIECLQSINQPPTATDPTKRRRSARRATLTIKLLTFNPFTINTSSKPQRKGGLPALSTINTSTKPQGKGGVPALSTISRRQFTQEEWNIQNTHNAQQGRTKRELPRMVARKGSRAHSPRPVY
jgi:hypothetical protein